MSETWTQWATSYWGAVPLRQRSVRKWSLPWQGRSSVACPNWRPAGLTVQRSTASNQWMSAVIWLTGTLKMTVHELLQRGLDDYIQHPCHHHHHRRRRHETYLPPIQMYRPPILPVEDKKHQQLNVLYQYLTNRNRTTNQTDKSTDISQNADLTRRKMSRWHHQQCRLHSAHGTWTWLEAIFISTQSNNTAGHSV